MQIATHTFDGFLYALQQITTDHLIPLSQRCGVPALINCVWQLATVSCPGPTVPRDTNFETKVVKSVSMQLTAYVNDRFDNRLPNSQTM